MDKMEKKMQTLKKQSEKRKKKPTAPIHACKERKNQSPDPCGAEEAKVDQTPPSKLPPSSSSSSSPSPSLSQG
jgi:hypothetical protein